MTATIWSRAVEWFAGEMETKLNKNEHKGGWESSSAAYLLRRLKQEVAELENACSFRGGEAVVSEAADVANFAMMIADNHGPQIGA